jgi:predicted AlkP superfamily phosphohydrolase/phosphomutase
VVVVDDAAARRLCPDAVVRQGDLDTFRADAFDLQRVQTEEALYLLQHADWDLFWVMSHTLDKLQHFFWRYMDPQHPAYPGPGPYTDTIRDFHVAFDRALARYLEAVPPDTNVVLLSDHGSAPLHTYFCVMNWLSDTGFLALRGGYLLSACELKLQPARNNLAISFV